MVDWEQALGVFVVGLSGVFFTLAVLLAAITLFSKIVTTLTHKGKKEG